MNLRPAQPTKAGAFAKLQDASGFYGQVPDTTTRPELQRRREGGGMGWSCDRGRYAAL